MLKLKVNGREGKAHTALLSPDNHQVVQPNACYPLYIWRLQLVLGPRYAWYNIRIIFACILSRLNILLQ